MQTKILLLLHFFLLYGHLQLGITRENENIFSNISVGVDREILCIYNYVSKICQVLLADKDDGLKISSFQIFFFSIRKRKKGFRSIMFISTSNLVH